MLTHDEKDILRIKAYDYTYWFTHSILSEDKINISTF